MYPKAKMLLGMGMNKYMIWDRPLNEINKRAMINEHLIYVCTMYNVHIDSPVSGSVDGAQFFSHTGALISTRALYLFV